MNDIQKYLIVGHIERPAALFGMLDADVMIRTGSITLKCVAYDEALARRMAKLQLPPNIGMIIDEVTPLGKLEVRAER